MTTGAIIAGGSASRLAGRPKGLEIIGGARIIDRVAGVLRPYCDRLLIAPGSLDATGWLRDATIAPDLLSVKASITGLHAAISASSGNVVVVAWDMPFVPGGLIAALAKAIGQSNCQAIVPIVNGKAEPLCAAYAKTAAPVIADAVKAGILKNSDVLARLQNIAWLEESELRRFGEPEMMFFNINTPADLARAEEMAQGPV